MKLSLDLDPDMGDAEFIEDVERVFRISLSQADVGHWLTLNDVHETIERLIEPSREGASACATSMSFYRIRRALRSSEYTSLRSSTELATLVGGRPRHFFKRIEQASGMKMPVPTLTNLGLAALITSLASIVALADAAASGAPILGGAALVGLIGSLVWIVKLDPGQLPNGVLTVRDLSELTALTNFSLLKEAGARERPGDSWRALVAVAAENSGIAKEEITQDHFLFRSVAKRAESAEVA